MANPETETESEPAAAGAIALEHLTGPSRGRVTWLSGADLDISLGDNRILRFEKTGTGAIPDGLLARLHQADGTYQIEAYEDQPVWVNGHRVSNATLTHCDMIEFGEKGPLSRIRLYRPDSHARQMVGDILTDGLAYLRMSRRPIPGRLANAFGGIFRRLAQDTTLLFRSSVVLALVGLAALSWYQNRLNMRQEQQIESSASRLEGITGVLTRAREEALTPGDLKALRHELAQRLSSHTERLTELERRSTANNRVIAQSTASVLFLQGGYGFREVSSGRLLRHVVDDMGRPLISPIGQPLLTLDGDGPVAERQFTGTGFAVGSTGAIITNRHVARPWEKDANVSAMQSQGLEPILLKYLVYMPGQQVAGKVEVVRVSEDADLAVLRHLNPDAAPTGLKLADTVPAPGDEIIVMGYPTGLKSMLAQSGEAFIEELQKAKDTGFWSVAARLAERKLIAPLSSRGIISQATPTTVVYDAETTHGGSGGPVLDVNGAVVAVNAAILPEYGGSNLGVPVARVRALLKAANLL
jgi:serine protease Do